MGDNRPFWKRGSFLGVAYPVTLFAIGVLFVGMTGLAMSLDAARNKRRGDDRPSSIWKVFDSAKEKRQDDRRPLVAP
jgi:hypothetical protein